MSQPIKVPKATCYLCHGFISAEASDLVRLTWPRKQERRRNIGKGRVRWVMIEIAKRTEHVHEACLDAAEGLLSRRAAGAS